MSTAARLEALRQGSAERGIEAMLVSRPENIRYLSGFNGSAGFLLISREKALLVTDFRYIEQAQRQAPGYEVVRIGGELAARLPELLHSLGVARLGFEAAHMTFAAYGRLDKARGESAALVPQEGLVESLRTVKNEAELDALSRACALADAAFSHIAGLLRPGMTEKQAAWEVEKFMRENGADALAFDTIVASGPNAALPHHHPGDRAIQEGEPIIFDLGAKVDGYCSDLSRTLCLGEPDGRFTRVYDLVLGAQLVALNTIQGGMTGMEADRLARTVIEQAGHGEAFGHGLGHGVGLEIHEGPRLGPSSTDNLADGMTFTVEPGVYLSGWGGVRIEDTVALREGKPARLTHSPK